MSHRGHGSIGNTTVQWRELRGMMRRGRDWRGRAEVNDGIWMVMRQCKGGYHSSSLSLSNSFLLFFSLSTADISAFGSPLSTGAGAGG